MNKPHYLAFDKDLNIVATFSWANKLFGYVKANPGLSWVNRTHPTDQLHGKPMADKLNRTADTIDC